MAPRLGQTREGDRGQPSRVPRCNGKCSDSLSLVRILALGALYNILNHSRNLGPNPNLLFTSQKNPHSTEPFWHQERRWLSAPFSHVKFRKRHRRVMSVHFPSMNQVWSTCMMFSRTLERQFAKIFSSIFASTFSKDIGWYKKHSSGFLPGLGTSTATASDMESVKAPKVKKNVNKELSLGASKSSCWE